jgi:tetratricopeptide (TPR) repeat protein
MIAKRADGNAMWGWRLERNTGRRAALLIASAEYRDERFGALRAPAHDAVALARVLADPTIGGFAVRTLIDKPTHLVAEEIEDFFADRDPDDLLLLHLSCHGVKDPNGRLYFATTSTRFSRLGATAISSDFLNEQLDRSRSRRIVVLLDCCYSGAFARGWRTRAGTDINATGALQGRGRVIITASNSMEYAFEDGELTMQVGQPSIFTNAVVKGLETGVADRDRDGLVSIDDLYDHVFDAVRTATPHQTPNKLANLQGDIYLARTSTNTATSDSQIRAAYERAIGSDQADVAGGAALGLGRLLERQGDLRGAEVAYQRAIDSGDQESVGQGYNSLGWLVQQRGDLAAAESMYRRAMEVGNRDLVAAAFNNLGWLFEQRGDPPAAEWWYRRAIDSSDGEQQLRAFNNMGWLSEQRGDWAAAEGWYRRAVDSNDPEQTARASNNLGSLFEKRGNLKAAEEWYRRAVTSNNSEQAARAMNGLGWVLQRRGDLAAAMPLYRRAMTHTDPDISGQAAINLGVLLERMGNLRDAEDCYRQAIDSRHPRHTAWGLNNIGVLRESLGDRRGAREAYERLAALGDQELSPRARTKLKELGWSLRSWRRG